MRVELFEEMEKQESTDDKEIFCVSQQAHGTS